MFLSLLTVQNISNIIPNKYVYMVQKKHRDKNKNIGA